MADEFIEMLRKDDRVTIDEGVDPTLSPDSDPDPKTKPDPDSKAKPDPASDLSINVASADFIDYFGKDEDDDDLSAENIGDRFKRAGSRYKDMKANSEKYNETTNKAHVDSISALEKERDELMKSINPLEHFTSEDSWKMEQMKKAFPKVSSNVITKVMGEGFEELSAIDSLRLYAEYKYKWTDQAKIDDWIEEKYGVELGDEDFAPSTMMEADAVDFKEKLGEIRETEIKAPLDYKAKLEEIATARTEKVAQSKTSWSPVVTKVFEKFESLPVVLQDQEGKDFTYEFKFEGKVLDGVQDKVLAKLSENNMPVNEDSLKTVMGDVYNDIIVKNFQKIFRAASGDLLFALDDKWSKATNNPRTLNRSERKTTTKSKTEQSTAELGAAILADA